MALLFTFVNLIYVQMLQTWYKKLIVLSSSLLFSTYYLNDINELKKNYLTMLSIIVLIIFYCHINFKNSVVLRGFLDKLNKKFDEEK